MTRYSISWQKIFGLLRSYRVEMIKANILALLAAASIIPIPLLFPELIELIVGAKTEDHLPSLPIISETLTFPQVIACTLFVCIVLRIVNLIFDIAQQRVFLHVSKDITSTIRRNLVALAKDTPSAPLFKRNPAELVSALTKDVSQIEEFIGAAASQALVSIATIGGALYLISTINTTIMFVIGIFFPLVLYASLRQANRIYEFSSAESSAYAKMADSLVSFFSGIIQLRISNRVDHYYKIVSDSIGDAQYRSLNTAARSNIASAQSALIYFAGLDSLYAVCLLMSIYADMGVADILSVMGYLYLLTSPFYYVNSAAQSFSRANSAIGRINSIIGEIPEQSPPAHCIPLRKQGVEELVAFSNVSFSYQAGMTPINRFQLTIEAGEKIALLGQSGSGKTTITRLMIALAYPDSGEIFYRGVKIRDVCVTHLREIIALVPQESFFWSGSIRENLTLGRDVDDAKLWHVLQIVKLDTYIDSLQNRLNFNLEANASNISGGQRQRLGIARALLHDFDLLILDEATSALDPSTESDIFFNIRICFKDKALIIITHRESSVTWVDRKVILPSLD